jgi:hypothetical protein
MSQAAVEILSHLKVVDAERRHRNDGPGLREKVAAVKAYQQRRFAHTYADVLDSPRYGAAARFFLDELYGPSDFTQRDAQFARVVPALVRLFPHEIVETVAVLGALHALSEQLDTAVGTQLPAAAVDGLGYVRAWQAAGHPAQRERQIALTVDVAGRLDRLTRRALIRNSLRLMRGPARAAGLSDLQRFLESGFESFRAMHGAHDFISLVREREGALASSLFQVDLDQPDEGALQGLLSALPP